VEQNGGQLISGEHEFPHEYSPLSPHPSKPPHCSLEEMTPRILVLVMYRKIKRQKGRQRSSLIFWLFDAFGGGGRVIWRQRIKKRFMGI